MATLELDAQRRKAVVADRPAEAHGHCEHAVAYLNRRRRVHIQHQHLLQHIVLDILSQ